MNAKTPRYIISLDELSSFTDTLINRDHELKLALNELPIGVFLCNEKGENLFVNTKYASMVGVNAKKLLGHGWQDYLSGKDLKKAMSSWNNSVATTDSYFTIVTFMKDGKEIKAFAYSVGVTDPNSKEPKYAGCVIPISLINAAYKECANEQ